MQVTVIGPESSVYQGEADAVTAPAYDGQVGILSNHAPFMTLLGTGVLSVRHGQQEHLFNVQGGFLQVVSNRVRVVAERVASAP